MDQSRLTAADAELLLPGHVTLERARALLDRGAELIASGDYQDALRCYRRVVGFDDPAVTGAALLGLGESLYRLDDDQGAISAWEAILALPDNPSTYAAWRNMAAARVREGELQGAVAAYRQAERRAPHEDRAEIASRLGWLAKELGDQKTARRYFARSRGDGPAIPLAMIVLGITVIVSFTAFGAADGFEIERLLWLDKFGVADGEYWRLWTVTLLHANFVHLGFNMFALYLAGPIVEQLYGSRLFLLFYLLCAAAGSTASFVFGGDIPAVGASGAIFGLFGVLLVASRAHHPVLDRRGRALVGQLGILIVINVAIGFMYGGRIDNAAHLGGLAAGAWLGLIVVPGRVPTLKSLWQRPGGGGAPGASAPGAGAGSGGAGSGGSGAGGSGGSGGRQGLLLPVLGVLALVVLIVVGIVIGTEARLGPGSLFFQFSQVQFPVDLLRTGSG